MTTATMAELLPPSATKYVLLDKEATKRILTCGESTYNALVLSGRLKSVKHGRSRRVRSDHLQEYLDGLTGGEIGG